MIASDHGNNLKRLDENPQKFLTHITLVFINTLSNISTQRDHLIEIVVDVIIFLEEQADFYFVIEKINNISLPQKARNYG